MLASASDPVLSLETAGGEEDDCRDDCLFILAAVSTVPVRLLFVRLSAMLLLPLVTSEAEIYK